MRHVLAQDCLVSSQRYAFSLRLSPVLIQSHASVRSHHTQKTPARADPSELTVSHSTMQTTTLNTQHGEKATNGEKPQ